MIAQFVTAQTLFGARQAPPSCFLSAEPFSRVMMSTRSFEVIFCCGANRTVMTMRSQFRMRGVGRPPNAERAVDPNAGQLNFQSFLHIAVGAEATDARLT
jgi:hypothetical protein